jgi:hypothetical protein
MLARGTAAIGAGLGCWSAYVLSERQKTPGAGYGKYKNFFIGSTGRWGGRQNKRAHVCA